MKAVLISFILLSTVVTAMIFNAIYVDTSINKMKNLAVAICEENGNGESMSELEMLWKRNKIILGFSASMRDIDRATEYMIRLSSAKSAGNIAEMRQVCDLLCNALDDIGRYERLSLSGIL